MIYEKFCEFISDWLMFVVSFLRLNAYSVAQIKQRHFIFLLVTNKYIYKIFMIFGMAHYKQCRYMN